MAQKLLPNVFQYIKASLFSYRKTAVILLLNLLWLTSHAQTITIPSGNTGTSPGNTTISRKPFGNFFGFERSAMIYTNSEIGPSGNITSVAFFVESLNSPAASTPVVIYMKQRATSSFSASTLVSDEETGATQVFSGNITSGQLSAGNWVTVTLTTPFPYSSASNLEIIVETNGGGTGIEPNPDSKQFRFSGTATSQFQYWQSDGTPPTFTGNLELFRPNVQLTLGAPSNPCSTPTDLAVTVTSTSAQLGFTDNTSTEPGTYLVKYGSPGFNFATGGTVVSPSPPAISAPPYNATGLTPGTNYEFAVQKSCTNGGTGLIEREPFTTTAAATCAAPTSVSATSVTHNSAQINFSGGDVGTTYTLQYGPTATFPTSGTTLVSMPGSPYSLTGLNASTAYSFVVRTNCSNGVTSANSPTGSFTTTAPPATCNPPTNLSATNVTNNSAQLNFTVSGGTSGTYTIEYGLAGFTPGTGTRTIVPGLTSSPYNATGLSASTSYEFYMYKNCGAGGTTSFVGPVGFTTTSTPATCDAPTNPAATNITNNAAQITFTESTSGSGGTYIIEYGPTNFTPGTGATANGGTVVTTSSSPANLTGLTPSTAYDFYIRKNCTVNGSGFSANTSKMSFTTIATPICTNGTWLGTTSTDWHTASNWCNNLIPTATTDVIIPASTLFAPIITQNASTRNLSINNGATLALNGGTTGVTLTINGLFSNNGTFTNTGNGSIVFTSNDLQTIGQSGQTTNLFDLTVGPGGANLGGPVGVNHLLTLNGNLNTNGQAFTLLADPANQAMVINNNGIVNGTTKMQRYFNPGLNSSIGYRHLSSPVTSTTISDIAAPGVNLVVNPLYNTSPTPSTVRPFPTIYSYDETRLTSATATTSAFTFGWKSPASTGDLMLPGQAFTVNMPPVNIDFNGTLNNGTIPVGPLTRGLTANSGWHFLGNPYPSPIDWDKVTVPGGLDNAVYIYRSNGQYTGQYISYVNGVGPANSDLIAACQGFFVRVNSGTPTFTFTNTMRVTSYENPAFYRHTSGPETRPLVTLALQNTTGQKDQTYIYFETGATATFDKQYDAFKLPNAGTAPILYSLANADALSINGLPLISTNTVVPLTAYVNAAGSYTFNAEQVLNLTSTPVYLEDRLMNTTINLHQQTSYTFNTTQTDLSGRFFLRFGPTTTTGITETELAAQTLIYPNPNHGQFTISMPLKEKGKVESQLYNAIGQQVWQKTFTPAQLQLQEEISLDNLPVGIYTIHLKSTSGMVIKKLIID